MKIEETLVLTRKDLIQYDKYFDRNPKITDFNPSISEEFSKKKLVVFIDDWGNLIIIKNLYKDLYA